ADSDWRPAVVFGVETAQDFERGEEVEAAIQPAAVGHGIQMATEEQCFFGGAGQSDPVVGGRIVMMLDGQTAQLGSEPLARFEPGVGPGDALRPVCVAGEGAEFFELGYCAFRIECHVPVSVVEWRRRSCRRRIRASRPAGGKTAGATQKY